MNEAHEITLVDIDEKPTRAALPALADNSPAAVMLAALDRGISPENIEKMMALQERWEANEARKAFARDLAAFKGEAVEIIKRKQVDFANSKGGRTQYKHAELFDVIEAVGPALSKHGFSWGFDTKQSDRWLDVTCILRHQLGHVETVTLGGPPDESGGKNTIQAWMSTKTYLERHTLKAICGVAEKGEDNDGAGGGKPESLQEHWIKKAKLADSVEEMVGISKDGTAAFNKARDREGYKAFAAAVQARGAELRKQEDGNA